MENKHLVIIPEQLAIKDPDPKLLSIINSKKFEDQLLYEKESDFHTISVVQNEVGRFLHYANTYQAGFIDTDFYKGNLPYINYFLIPYLLKKDIKKILLVGMGTGLLVKQYELLFENYETIDVVDIEENILEIAKNYFGFEESVKFNFTLQDGRIFLRQTKNKYDLIVVDVANNDGIDARFLEDDYLDEVKSALKKGGIFVSNLCSSAQFDHPDNRFLPAVLEMYKKYFKNTLVFKGDYSDEVYYKSFFGIDERVIDVTNVILISFDFEVPEPLFSLREEDRQKFFSINVDIQNYLLDFTLKT